MTAYYNEIEPFAVAWLRELIKRGLIADGVVDDRSIEVVQPADLTGYTQCHFFAGIGVWSYALRSAGWPDDRPVWTGSCPCQPFSAAGKGKGFDDARHLWPAWFRLVGECRPDVVFGEQVSSGDGLEWLDAICADMEGAGYAVGALDTCAAGVGAPHIRQRLYFVANTGRAGDERECRPTEALRASRAIEGETRQREWSGPDAGDRGAARVMADTAGERRTTRHLARADLERDGLQSSQRCATSAGVVGDTDGIGRTGIGGSRQGGTAEPSAVGDVGHSESGGRGEFRDASLAGSGGHAERTSRPGFWDDVIWIPCRDGKTRPAPAEPALFPLAPGTPARLGLLRGSGNGLNAEQAAAFIEAYRDITEQ